MAVAEPVTRHDEVVVPRPGGVRLLRSRTGRRSSAGLWLLGGVTLVALAAPLLAPHSATLPVPAGPFRAPLDGALLGPTSTVETCSPASCWGCPLCQHGVMHRPVRNH